MTQDLGRHFLLGDIILKTWNVPKTNLFSYTYPDFPFINLHWLSEVVFYLIFKFIGFNGLLIFSTLIVVVAFALLYFKALKKDNAIPLSIISVFYLRVLFERTDIRPEIFSFLFLSIFILVLYKFRKSFTKWIFILPLLGLIWVNTHIYFMVGVATFGMFLIDHLIVNWHKLKTKKTFFLFIAFFLTCIATLFNPNGITGAYYPFIFNKNYGYAIEENQNIIFLWQLFRKETIIYFTASVISLFIFLSLNFRKTKPVDWFLSIFFTAVSIFAIRNFPLFVFGTFIPFANTAALSFKKLSPNLKRVFLIFVLFLFLWQIPKTYSLFEFGFGTEKGAEKAVDFFVEKDLKGPIFNNFDIGSYLGYRLYPKERVFVDGRPGEYPASFFQNTYIPMQQDLETFKKVEQRYNFNVIMFSHTDQTPWAINFLNSISKEKTWKMVYLDSFMIMFLKENEQNNLILKTLTMNNKDVQKVIDTTSSEKELTRLLLFFKKTGMLNEEILINQKLIANNPNSCVYLSNLLTLLSVKQDPALFAYSSRFNNLCK
ncbi:hypothetical protein KKG52_02045 [Patescibacteria group bacterium]|nr:hypothetical protein [Patescibacteria group bacterium]